MTSEPPQPLATTITLHLQPHPQSMETTITLLPVVTDPQSQLLLSILNTTPQFQAQLDRVDVQLTPFPFRVGAAPVGVATGLLQVEDAIAIPDAFETAFAVMTSLTTAPYKSFPKSS